MTVNNIPISIKFTKEEQEILANASIIVEQVFNEMCKVDKITVALLNAPLTNCCEYEFEEIVTFRSFLKDLIVCDTWRLTEYSTL